MLLCLRFLIAFTIIWPRAYAQSPICYGRTGVQLNDLFACQPDAPDSGCCVLGDICYSNGLCTPSPTKDPGLTPFYWQGCTDPTYKSPECFSACYSVPGNGVAVCANRGPNHYCCYGLGGCDCSDPEQVFSMAPATIVTTIDRVITSSSTTARASTSSSSTTARVSTSSSTTATSSTPVETSASTPAVTSTAPTPLTPPTAKANNAVAIGVGVGVGVPIAIAVAALIYFFIRRRSQGKGVPSPPLMAVTAQKYDTGNHEIGNNEMGNHEMEANLNSEVELPGQTEYQYRSRQYPLGELPAH